MRKSLNGVITEEQRKKNQKINILRIPQFSITEGTRGTIVNSYQSWLLEDEISRNNLLKLGEKKLNGKSKGG